MTESLETLQRWDVSKESDRKQVVHATIHVLHIVRLPPNPESQKTIYTDVFGIQCLEKYWDLLDALRDGTTNGGQTSYLNTDPYWSISLELEAHNQIFQVGVGTFPYTKCTE
jgi:hypothetical protein